MVAVVEVDAGQAAKRSKATDEEGKTPPQQPVGATRKPRQPTPDHPPYCWMISEAIDALCEDGGSEEDSISAFIRARHPGVPAAHDRLLRHYLVKHVAEGFFVCTAAGRYLRNPEENTDVERPVEQAAAGLSKPACVGSPVAEAKRGRGRPRKDGSSSTPPADKKDGARSATPKRRGHRRAVAELAADEDSVPTSLVAVADNKDGGQVVSSTSKLRGQRHAAVTLAAAENSVPASLVAVADMKDGRQGASSTPKRRGRLRKLGMATTTVSSDKALVAGKEDGSEVPYTPDKEHEPPHELALVIVGDGSTTTSIMDKACAETPTMALVTTTDIHVPAPMPAMDKKDGCDAPSFNLVLMAKNDAVCTMESSSRACELALGSVPVLIADKDGVEEAPSVNYKPIRQPRKLSSDPTAGKKGGSNALPDTPKGRRRQCKPVVVATGDPSALAPVAGKKSGGKVSFASPKLTPVTAVGCSTPASVADQDGIEAHKLYPVTADEIPDDPACCLLALPA